MPFYRSIRDFGREGPGTQVQPTAQAFEAEVTATSSRVPPVAGFGLGTRFQAMPFQCRIRVLGFAR